MRLRKKQHIVKILRFVEDRISDKTKAQRFRRWQHELFGLTPDEWASLALSISCHESLDIAVQRQGWLEKECARLKGLQEPYDPEIASAYHMTRYEKTNNETICEQLLSLKSHAEKPIASKAIFRALWHTQCADAQTFTWHLTPWLVERCVLSGGCCGRSCECCTRARCDLPAWANARGHCTPACPCCGERNGLQGPISVIAPDPNQLPFSLRPDRSDRFSWNMMDALVWGIGDC
ncbi:uncharacterized protein DSM5745_01594 [Aspergillus mulundensis]|uniref:Uncharacterized protein n=1 Tax=Aspergillus mulundensis TaxID=1810919 RepID=A0A3D8SU38_9EURO|nr:hypothetical protein DSM5745_01594 [Aspergillus mulundensis]RDW89819.1 hypothetical protein DSM5745_01594 [Aspergillus mulundensis]